MAAPANISEVKLCDIVEETPKGLLQSASSVPPLRWDTTLLVVSISGYIHINFTHTRTHTNIYTDIYIGIYIYLQ